MSEVQLKRIVKADGTQVRMADLKEGDVFDMYMTEDGVEQHLGRWQADADGHIQMPDPNVDEFQHGLGAVIAHPVES